MEKEKGLYQKFSVTKLSNPNKVVDAIVLEFDDPIARQAIAFWSIVMMGCGYLKVASDTLGKLIGLGESDLPNDTEVINLRLAQKLAESQSAIAAKNLRIAELEAKVTALNADNYRVISGGAYDGGMTIKNSSGEQIELKKFNIIAEIEKLLGSSVGFSFTCNDHKLCYAEIREYVKEKDDNFFSEEDKKACIDSNKIYELRWYPDSPIGSYCICAPSPERILEILKQEENG